MKYKKIMLILITTIFLVSIAGVCASDANDTLVASEDTNQIEISDSDKTIEDNLQTNEENPTLTVEENDETLSSKTDSEILTADQFTYSNLREQIGSGGNINLTKGTYTYNDGDGDTIQITTPGVINGNGAVIDMAQSGHRAFNVATSDVTIKNLTIKNANYNGYGGAIYFESTGTVTNCNFTGNKATGVDNVGGAVYIRGEGTVTNCNFTNNKATQQGGAINMNSGTVTNCNFVNNAATGKDSWGGAIVMYYGSVSNCNFADNSADSGGAILSVPYLGVTADTCIFKTDSDTTFNTNNLQPTLNVDDFTTFCGTGEKLTFNLTTNSGIPVTNGKISISLYYKDNGIWVGNYSCLSGEGLIVDLPGGHYYAIFDTEYAEFQPINKTITITYYVNVASVTTTNKTVNITAKSNIPNEVIKGKLLFILPNGENITADYAGNGIWWAIHRFDDYAVYQVNASYIGLDNVTINNATITVSKANTVLTADAVTATYNINKNLVITLKDANGNVISGAKLTVKLNGKKQYTTDANGQAKVNVAKLVPKTYTARITFDGDDAYVKSAKNVQVTVKKAKAKIVAKKKTFKRSKKVKKYTVTLKANSKALAKVKLTLKIKGKTYKAKTNAKGKAVFKIKKLTKKGTYTATSTFKGDKYYKKATKKVKIKIK